MSTKKPFSFDLHPGIASDVEAAFNGLKPDADVNPLHGDGSGNSDVEPLLTGVDGLEQISPSFFQIINSYRLQHRQILNHQSNKTYDIPELNDRAFNSVKWAKLEDAYTRMLTGNWSPSVVFGKNGLIPDFWIRQFANTKNLGSNIEVRFGELAIQNWRAFDPTTGWSVQVMPTTTESPMQRLTQSLDETEYRSRVHTATQDNTVALELLRYGQPDELHPTVDAYLAAQALRKVLGLEMLDQRGSTWLAGRVMIKGENHSLGGRFVTSNNVHIEADLSSMLYGVRPTIVG